MIGKYLLAIALTAAIAFLAGLYLPWWTIAFAGFAAALLVPQKPGHAFLSSFVGGFMLWEVLCWMLDHANNGILSLKIARLMGLGNSAGLLIVVGALVGGLVTGLAAITATFLRRLVVRPKTEF